MSSSFAPTTTASATRPLEWRGPRRTSRLMPLFAGSADSTTGDVRVSPPSVDGYYPEGVEVTMTAVPRPGYSFFNWAERTGSRDHGPALNPVTLRVVQPVRYIAEFTSNPFTAVVTEPPGFDVIVDGARTTAPANFVWAAGSEHTLEATPVRPPAPDSDTRVLGPQWSDGGPLARTVTAAETGSEYKVVYQRQFQLQTGRDTILSPSSPDGFYDEGAQVALSADPAPPSEFTHWTGDAAGNQLPLLWAVTAPAFLQANFSVPGATAKSGLVNAASLQSGELSPGEIITIIGAGIGPQRGMATGIDPATGRFPVEAAGVKLSIAGKPAPLLYVSAKQINAVAPFGFGEARIGGSRTGLQRPALEPRILRGFVGFQN